MSKRILIDEAHRIPRYTRLTGQYSCGHAFLNDTWEGKEDIPQSCCECGASLERINPEFVVGKRPSVAETVISHNKVYMNRALMKQMGLPVRN